MQLLSRTGAGKPDAMPLYTTNRAGPQWSVQGVYVRDRVSLVYAPGMQYVAWGTLGGAILGVGPVVSDLGLEPYLEVAVWSHANGI